ncbi:DUF2149 domain-containing protein [Methanosphaera sp. BMS]|uniref:DUF2149 domain-containing protein n=1 Tax=Methanosphaera sp. BMS TaxID=1789762 RepID=UPI000DC1DAD8|nr:DUF2149 domain-containing protein [Methanosphaera sp. BMS]AWX32968.1 hypothetical protein AW729_07595 [Methanosphaera sp. BMS]
MLRDNSRSFIDDEEEDPTASLVNMVDIMLVLAVGFLILAITATGVMDMSSNTQQSHSQMVDVEEGQEIPNDIEQSDSSGSGYSQVGTVYKDPKTGKLVMVDS